MNNAISSIFCLMIGWTCMLWSCSSPSNQGHEHEAGAHETGHAHESRPNIDTTIRKSGWELFVEYPAFVAGEPSRFAVHITRLSNYTPLSSGKLTAIMIKGDQGIRHAVNTPSSPGIFEPALQPQEAGKHKLSFQLQKGDTSLTFKAGHVRVFANAGKADKALAGKADNQGSITFTKEDAWKTGIGVSRVRQDTMLHVLEVSGAWMTAPGEKSKLTAGAEGNVLYAMPDLLEGRKVQQGDILMKISGKNLNTQSIEAKVQQARAEYRQAQKAYKRKKELYQLDVIPDSEWNNVEKNYQVAQSRYQQLLKNYAPDGIQVKAPFSGYIQAVHIENGAYANTGQSLLTITLGTNQLIKAYINPDNREQVKQTRKIWVKTGDTFRSKDANIVSIGNAVSRQHPMLPVFISVLQAKDVVNGSLAEVQLGYSTREKQAVMIPASALLEDFGQYRVIVQQSGESYELKPVSIGGRNGSLVSITEGLQPGEWVVSRGAYRIKMASEQGQQAGHGHAH